jgi:tetraacyldisaccharide 4'-kinase
LLKSFRYLLFPISLLYGGVIALRNYFYDKKILKSVSFNFPIICIGNIAVGGTGKSPMAEYLIELLYNKYNVATLSRGYKRRTKGYAIATEGTTALDIGDEPLQFYEKYKGKISVAVGEERIVAIPQLLQDAPNTNVIILDDGFQHRKIKAGLNIVLSDYSNLYYKDFMLPTGDLRDVKGSMQRANIIVITKCYENISEVEKNNVLQKIKATSAQKVFFTAIAYGNPYHLFTKQKIDFNKAEDILLVVGIANPKPLKEHLSKNLHQYEMLKYADHHIFTIADLKEIKNQFEKNKTPNKIILTTEKDAVRLQKFGEELSVLPIYVLPIEQKILFEEAPNFENEVLHFIQNFKNE